MRTPWPKWLCAVLSVCAAGVGGAVGAPADADDSREIVAAVCAFAETVLQNGRDVYGPRHTPLFVDGCHIETREPVKWRYDGQEWILSNLAAQQTLFRTLDALTALTGDPRYRRAAIQAIRFAFDHLRAPNGLLYWGGHCAYDAAGDRVVGEVHGENSGGHLDHELKCHYPYYELMWAADPLATRRFIEAFWQAHILDWSKLDMNRHGSYTAPTTRTWPQAYEGGEVFFAGQGLSFVNTGSDLYYAAGMLHRFTGQEAPLTWAKRLAHRYVETRNPKTGLGGYQYSRYVHGDRAQKQFGPEFGDRVWDATLLVPDLARRKFADAGGCQLILGEKLGDAGREFVRWAVEDLTAYGSHAYRAEDNTFCALITDGTRLGPEDVRRKGYYGPARSDRFKPGKADLRFFRVYALAFRLSGDAFIWQMTRDIARGNGLGDIGATSSAEPRLDMETVCASLDALSGMLDIYRRTGRGSFIVLAKRLARNILKDRYRNGLFVTESTARFAKFDSPEPLALLRLAAVLRGMPEAVSWDWAGEANFHCRMDGLGRVYDNEVLYGPGRQESGP